MGKHRARTPMPRRELKIATWVIPPTSVNGASQVLTIGYVLPPDVATVSSPDYIGLIVSGETVCHNLKAS
jgi:hypothetical protein